ncbi:translation initiation factor IF-2 [Polycladomyces subterraneus]|uniref:Translation initiation factor IF-2 n=1 Tax=Polycladomyces subterraneus TaxID=1016997 RepID=A0ABT8INT2_9BACL|nr:translation initiation factor IF-2 [Polycladomyces subterraneus]MDN4594455.1 translation initiation factor IF-2 [Polycladomyces subterraneus]
MTKLRVYEYAKQMNMSSKEVLTILQRMNINVNNHMSVMDDQMVQKVEQFIKNVKEQNAPIKAKQSGVSGNKRPNGSSKTQEETKGQPKAAEQKNMGGKNKEVNMKKQRNKAANDTGETVGIKGKSSRKGAFDNRENGGKKGRGKKQKDRNRRPAQSEKPAPKLPSEIEISGPMTVGEAAKLMRREAADVIRKLMGLGVLATINQEIDPDTITLVAEEYGIKVKVKEEIDESAFEEIEEIDDPEDLQERPPVVTIMGHVDHGKTTLLDTIRHSNITAGEAGGITQHIGAYQVEANGKKITFLDTPGHAAFTTMRARGAKVTDITVLVVAADDGVMPQTVEAINHAKAADVPIIVAVNKMDKPDANPDRVKQQLMEHGLVPEEWGGDTIFVPVSALKGEGIDELLEMILLVAEVQELKANPNKRARGVVIEAELDKGRGPVATVLVQNGTLRVGDSIVAGNYFGKVRAMVNDRGRRIKAAPPSTPVEILGLQDVPNAGDAFMVFEDEKKARAIAEKRAEKQRQQELRAQSRVTLDDLYKQIQEGEVKELNIIIKADVQGSVEALRGALEKIDVEGVRVKIIHSAVGAITESDIILASASNAIIIGFNVRPEPNARATAEQEKVDIRLHRVIYNVIEEIEAAMKGMLDPEYEEKVVGSAEVRQIFKVSRIGTIAGCYVTEGKIVRDGKVRLIRDGIVVHDGEIDTLKRFKDDVREVAQGYECGLTLKNFNDIKEGDVVEVYVIQEVER